MSTLKHRTISGIKWQVGASMVRRVISFGGTVILARILSPADFGLFALAFVMIDAFQVFKSLGFDTALVRRKGDIDKACNTAFLLIPAMGMVLFVIVFFFAPIGAKFLNNPQVTPIIRSLAIIFIISTFGKVPQTILYRDMKFKYKSIAEVSSSLIAITTTIVLALNKFGVWSLVVGYISYNIIQISMEWYFSGWKPKFEFDKELAWEMFHFGKYVLVSSIIWFIYGNLDNITISKVLNVTMLGYYGISRNISNFLNDYLLNRIGSIMYPAYSKIQEDPESVARAMLKIIKYISVFTIPFSLGLSLFASDILRIVFGSKWIPASDILRILSFVGLFGGLGSVMWPAFLAKGQSKIDFQIGAAQVCLFFVLIVPLALKFQLIGVGLAALISSVIGFIVGLIRIKTTLALSPKKILESLKSPLVCSIFMFIVASILKLLHLVQSANFNFLISAGISALAYFGAIYLLDRNIIKDMKKIIA